jgi:hypothetical protein
VKTSFRVLAPLLAISLMACATYSKAKRTPLSYEAVTPAGVIIAETLKQPKATPQVRIGGYLDAAETAALVLKKNPTDPQARSDYNFALSRIVEEVHDSGLDLTRSALHCPGAAGEWVFAVKTPDKLGDQSFTDFRVVPTDRYEFKGRLVKDRSIKEGLGATVVVSTRGFNPLKIDPFAQGRQSYFGMTVVVDFQGRNCHTRIYDPLVTEEVTLAGHSYPLAADFTAPLALALAELKPRKQELERLFKPEEFRESIRLARLQPYEASKIPLLLIHGLGDSQATWAPMVEALRNDPIIRKNYQIWFFSYATGYPYPLTASLLRQQLVAIKKQHPDHKKMVVIGHSMGGMIARTLITDSELKIWNAIFENPPPKKPSSDSITQLLENALIFKPQPDVARVIFCSASLGGSETATGFVGRLGAKLIGTPKDLKSHREEFVLLAKPKPNGVKIKQFPNSIDLLDPKNRFITTINSIPPARGIPYHSIMGDRGKGGNLDRTKPQSTDGIVPYWSSHIAGAQSELIIPSHHWSNQHPLAIEEVRRILMQHLKETSRSLP